MEVKEAKEVKETKLCKHCQTEIPKKAKVCPNCRKKQGGIFKWIVIAIIVFMLLGSCIGGSKESTEEKASDSNPQKVDTVKVEETSEAKEISNEFNVGDVVETSDFKISFLSAGEYKDKYIQPKDGCVYYRMEFEFENIGDSDATISSMMNWTCYADDYSVDQAWVGDDQIDATLSPGKKVKGGVYFEVPADANKITLEYETNFWSEDKVIFIVK